MSSSGCWIETPASCSPPRSRSPTVLYGIARLPEGHRKELLRTTASEVFAAFEGQVLPFDSGAAVHYAQVVGGRDNLGLPIDGFDAQIAAICRAHRAALATRNVKDFRHIGVNLIDPWSRTPLRPQHRSQPVVAQVQPV